MILKLRIKLLFFVYYSMTLSHACKINLSQLGHVMKGAHLWECREERNREKGRDEEGEE